MSLFETAFELSHESMAIVGLDGLIVRANAAWETTLGHPPEALQGRPFAELLTPEEAPHFAAWLAAAGPRERHVKLRARTGLLRLMHLRAAPEPGSDAVLLLARPSWLGADELAHLRAVEQRWDGLLRCLTDFVVTSDTTGMVMTINREVPGIPTDALVGQPESMFTPIAPDQRPALRERFARVIGTGETLSYETQVEYPDGSIGTFESRLGPIHADAAITGTVLVTRDLTGQRQAEEARLRAEQQIRAYTIQLERSNGELERFASVASHDLQEPLRKIQAFGDRLRQKYEELLPEPGRDYLNRMQEAARRMQDLINDLLVFSRLTTKEQRFVPVDLEKILTAVLSDLEVRIEENDATIERGPLPVIEADPLHMRQLFQNLISNAIKFRRPDRAPVVAIAAEQVPARGELPAQVRITVRDNGIGVDPKYHERIFGIFERLHSRGKYEGTGVGLAVCRKICEQHGGSIHVDLAVRDGCAFVAALPARHERLRGGERS